MGKFFLVVTDESVFHNISISASLMGGFSNLLSYLHSIVSEIGVNFGVHNN